MKIRNKIIALMISLIAIPSFALAKDGAYVGAKISKITVKYNSFDGFNGDTFLPGDFKALDLYGGYNVGNGFFEIAYLNSDKDTKSGAQTVGGVTLTGTNVGIEFDGFRIGAGYNFNLQNNITLKPFINYYDLKFKGSGTITASAGSNRISAEASGSDRDQGIDAGLGLDYVINNQSKIGISYSQFIDKFQDTDSTKVYSINYSYQF
jgi:hypothetical protein